MSTFANSEDNAVFIRVYTVCMFKKRISDKKCKNYNLMDYPKFTVAIQMEESISIHRVTHLFDGFALFSLISLVSLLALGLRVQGTNLGQFVTTTNTFPLRVYNLRFLLDKKLTIKAPPIICSRRQFQILLLFPK